jgi:hypothetical protein
MIRGVVLALLGIVSGLALGVLGAFAFVWIWLELLHLPSLDPDDPKGGLTMLFWSGVILLPACAIGLAAWLVRRDRRERFGPAALAMLAVPAALSLVLAFVLVHG